MVTNLRMRVVETVLKATNRDRGHRLDDSIIMDSVIPQPKERASECEVKKLFVDGADTQPGAYGIHEMIEAAGHLDEWKTKLSDAYDRYVKEELQVFRRNLGKATRSKHAKRLSATRAARFVHDILHFPMEDGEPLRNRLSNLEEIAASRNALKLYLSSHEVFPEVLIANPLRHFNELSNRAVLELLKRTQPDADFTTNAELRHLLGLNALLNNLDHQRSEFGRNKVTAESLRAVAAEQFNAADDSHFHDSLGGDSFVQEFLEDWLSPTSKSPASMVYLTHANGQLIVSLKCIEAFLSRRPSLSVVVVPKNGQHGNEASWNDLENVLEADFASASPQFHKLWTYLKSGRLVICHDGPRMQGLHPGCLSQELCYHLRKSDVVFAEGQAYAEVRGWRKPTYLLFQVKGRVAESIHGVSRHQKALVFVRVGHGAIHYSHINGLSRHIHSNSGTSRASFRAYGQTTVDYVAAVKSGNFRILRDLFFRGNEERLQDQLRAESHTTGKTTAEIVLGTQDIAGMTTRRYRTAKPVDVFAIGGGGGFAKVTLKALGSLDVRVTAGVPSTDDGGSTGRLQHMLFDTCGYVFGIGDAAAILEQQVAGMAKWPILSYRPSRAARSLVKELISHIRREISKPSIKGHPITRCDDYLSFVCEQLNFARIIDRDFMGIPGFTVEGASIRNLNILAAFKQTDAIQFKTARNKQAGGIDAVAAERAWFLLEEAFGLSPGQGKSIHTVPVTYDPASLWATYSVAVPKQEIKRLRIPNTSVSKDFRTVYGQQFIDQIVPAGKIIDFGITGHNGDRRGPTPNANPAYLDALKSARLIIMGAGSLFSSLLAQLAIPGVLDALARRKDVRRVLIVNHVCMNETMFYSLTDHIVAIERLANEVAGPATKRLFGGVIRIGDMFTDIIVPRTVAREIDAALTISSSKHRRSSKRPAPSNSGKSANAVFVNPDGTVATRDKGILRNRYVAYILDHPEFRAQQQITDWEIRVLGYMDQPPFLYKHRSESGRYRGAVYATNKDIEFLLSHGIPRRHIYEVESIAMNKKILKAEGKPRIEEFPGLIPESLVGIFKILLAKGVESA